MSRFTALRSELWRGRYWHRTAGSPTQPITAHQFTWVLIITTCKSFHHSASSTPKHQLTSVSSLVQTLLDSSIDTLHWLCSLLICTNLLCHPQRVILVLCPPSLWPILLLQSRIPRVCLHPRSPGTGRILSVWFAHHPWKYHHTQYSPASCCSSAYCH